MFFDERGFAGGDEKAPGGGDAATGGGCGGSFDA